jgi:hypothetical protein
VMTSATMRLAMKRLTRMVEVTLFMLAMTSTTMRLTSITLTRIVEIRG